MSEFIGKTISLISTNDVRYVGVLTSISSTESTVSLAHVVSYGTEGRRGGHNELYPAPQMIPELVFKGADVKDLKVMQDQQVSLPPQAQYPPSAFPPSQVPNGPQQPRPQATQRPAQQLSQPATQPATQQPQKTAQAPAQAPTKAPAPAPAQAPAQAPTAPAAPANDALEAFDFGATQKFAQEKESAPQEPATYDKKKSFFDDLSAGTEPEGRAQERGLNMETFGQPGNVGRGGRRGRGGRGRGRGRGSS